MTLAMTMKYCAPLICTFPFVPFFVFNNIIDSSAYHYVIITSNLLCPEHFEPQRLLLKLFKLANALLTNNYLVRTLTLQRKQWDGSCAKWRKSNKINKCMRIAELR